MKNDIPPCIYVYQNFFEKIIFDCIMNNDISLSIKQLPKIFAFIFIIDSKDDDQ